MDESAGGLASNVGSFALRVSSDRPEGAAASEDDSGIVFGERLVADAPALEGSWNEVGEDDVGGFDQFQEGFLPGIEAQIDRHASFAAVATHEEGPA